MLTKDSSLSSAPPMATRDSSGPETILVVDDDPVLLALVDLLLGRNGYLVESVDDPEKAWDMISADRAKISLLLTDVGIPGTIGGVALAERVRYFCPDLPVLLMTGTNLLEDEAPEVISFWDKKLLRKPFSSDRLLATIGESLKSAANGL
jgi:DNA-binding NtrC family response regulator